MAELLSNKVRGERVQENLNTMLQRLLTITKQDADTISKEMQEKDQEEYEVWTADFLDKMTCGQLVDLVRYIEYIEYYAQKASNRRARSAALRVLGVPDPDDCHTDHSMCEAERQMYTMLDELDAHL